jgi:hypothetical protein
VFCARSPLSESSSAKWGKVFWLWEKFLLRKVKWGNSLFALRKVHLTSWVPIEQISNKEVYHTMVLPFTLKSIIQKKIKIMKIQIFHLQEYNLWKEILRKKEKSFKIS